MSGLCYLRKPRVVCYSKQLSMGNSLRLDRLLSPVEVEPIRIQSNWSQIQIIFNHINWSYPKLCIYPAYLEDINGRCNMGISPPVYISPPTLYGHVTGFFWGNLSDLEKSHRFPVKKPITHNRIR